MKRITATLSILLMLIPNLAFAEDQQVPLTITKEYEFTTTSHIFEYTQGASFEPQNEIKEDGIKYQLRSIEYELISEKDLFITAEETFTMRLSNWAWAKRTILYLLYFLKSAKKILRARFNSKKLPILKV